MNKIYGFEGEVKAKYDDKTFDLFLEVFEFMPLPVLWEGKSLSHMEVCPLSPELHWSTFEHSTGM